MQDRALIIQKVKKVFLFATIVFLSVSALLGILLILTGTSIMQIQTIGTTVILGAFSVLVLSNISRIDNAKPLLRVLAWLALLTGLVAAVIMVLAIWGAFNQHSINFILSLIFKVAYSCSIIAVNATIIGRFLVSSSSNTLAMTFRNATIADSAFLCVFFVASILCGNFPAPLWRFIIILVILLVLGLIVTPILFMIGRQRDDQINDASHPIDEQTLRAQIEREVRAQIAAEQQEASTSTEKTVSSTKQPTSSEAETDQEPKSV